MRIQLGQEEIITGIKMYLTSVGVNSYGKEVKVDFTSTRKPGAGGLIADVDITFVPATVIPGGLITREYAPEFRSHTLGESAIDPHNRTQNLLAVAGAGIDASIAVDLAKTADTTAVVAISEDGDLEVHSSGSILDEVLAGVDEQKEEEPVAVKVATATSSLFATEE